MACHDARTPTGFAGHLAEKNAPGNQPVYPVFGRMISGTGDNISDASF
jgi:hypothetical protein